MYIEMENYMQTPQHMSGYVSELTAALYYSQQGYEIYWPNFSQSQVDFIAAKGVVTKRIQVKTAYWMNRPTGASYLQATTRKGNGATGSRNLKGYTKQDCDEICIIYENDVWVIPVEDLNEMQSVVVRKGNHKHQRKSYVDFKAEEYKVR